MEVDVDFARGSSVRRPLQFRGKRESGCRNAVGDTLSRRGTRYGSVRQPPTLAEVNAPRGERIKIYRSGRRGRKERSVRERQCRSAVPPKRELPSATVGRHSRRDSSSYRETTLSCTAAGVRPSETSIQTSRSLLFVLSQNTLSPCVRTITRYERRLSPDPMRPPRIRSTNPVKPRRSPNPRDAEAVSSDFSWATCSTSSS